MVLIVRNLLDYNQTRGRLTVLDEDYHTALYSCNTLELAWNNNEKRISCIPEGTYQCVKHISPKFGLCVHIKDVPDRSHILIHKGNYAYGENVQTHGCILVGKGYADINKDGVVDILNSGKTFDELMNVLPFEFELKIEYTEI